MIDWRHVWVSVAYKHKYEWTKWGRKVIKQRKQTVIQRVDALLSEVQVK